MNKIKNFAAVSLLIVGCTVSFYAGRNYESEYYNYESLHSKYLEYKDFYNTHSHEKDYEAACLQADFIRYLIDHFDGETECANIGSEIDECYEEFFQELPYGGFKTNKIKHIRDFEDYSWCY